MKLEVFVFVAGFVGLLLLITSCKSAYPPCNATDAGNLRCYGTHIAVCDGEVWHSQYDCGDLRGPDGEDLRATCLADTSSAACVYGR